MRLKALVASLALSTVIGNALAAAPAWGAEAAPHKPAQKQVSLAYVNDIHAQLEPHPELFWRNGNEERVHNAGGLARIATAFEQLAQERPHGMLRIDGGDTFQGSGPGAWTRGEVMVRPMNALQLDVAIPGNWAVAYGAEQLKHLSGMLNYPLIAANIFDQKTGERTFPPYLIREVNGVRIGLIGFTDPDVPTRQPPFMSAGLHFAPANILQPLIDHVRSDEKVDVVVLITHIGLHKSVPLADQLRGVDILLSSDTHERTYEPIMRGETLIVEAGSFGSFVGVLDLMLENGRIVERRWQLLEMRAEAFPEDPAVQAIVEDVLQPHRERMNREIGYTDIWLERYNVMSTSMDRLIADAIREKTQTEVGLSNGYRFSPPTAPGPITENDLWNWLPIALPLKQGQASGQQLIEYWEREFENVFSRDPEQLYGGWLARPSTNLQIRFDSTDQPGRRLKTIEIDGAPLDPAKTYTLAAGTRKGSPDDQIHRVPHCRAIEPLEVTTHDAVREYLQRFNPVSETGQPPLRCTVRPPVVRSQFLEYLLGRDTEAAP